MKALDISGKVFGRLFVVNLAPKQRNRTAWFCRCDCGETVAVATSRLTTGRTQSCGCLLADKNRARLKTHGHSLKAGRSLTYKSYTNMVTRCENPNAIHYDRYGGAGVKICSRWRSGESGKSGFECFFEDMGPRPSSGHSIDRYQNRHGDYELANCRWAIARSQTLNRSSTVMIDVRGYQVPLAVACELAGVNYGTAWLRLRRGQPWNGGGA